MSGLISINGISNTNILAEGIFICKILIHSEEQTRIREGERKIGVGIEDLTWYISDLMDPKGIEKKSNGPRTESERA